MYTEQVEALRLRFDEKRFKTLYLDVFVRLCRKLEDVDVSEINESLATTVTLLEELSQDETIKPRAYLTSFRSTQKLVRNQLGFVARGVTKEESIGIGIALGVALGGGFLTLGPAFVGVGIPIGLAIGVVMGNQREKDLEKANKLY